MEEFLTVIGAIASVLTIGAVTYSICKWVSAKLRNRTDSVSRTAATLMNAITIAMERTVIVPL